MPSYVIGVDVGTTGAKVVLLDEDWAVLAQAGSEYPTRYVGDRGAEQDAADWWTATADGVRSVIERAAIWPGEVAAVAVSSQAPTVVPVNTELEPLRPAVLWMDRRGQGECAARWDEADAVLARTGNRLDAYFAAPTLAWLLDAEPQLRERTRTVLMAAGFVAARLTGEATCDTGHAGLSLLTDLGATRWAADLAEWWGVPLEWLPRLVAPTDVIGDVRPDAAARTGLRAGTPVVAGGVDGVTGSLASGVATHGNVCEMTGHSTVVNAAFGQQAFAEAGELWRGALSVLPYPVAGHHLVYGAMVATGGILRWFRDEFADRELAAAGQDGDAFALLDELAAQAAPGAGGLVLLPYFHGERSPIWDPDARGVLLGLSMATRRCDVVRAILEGTAYALAHNLDELRRIGLEPARVRAVGGGARGSTWTQVKADVCGVSIERAEQPADPPVGAGLLAGAGVGLTEDLAATVHHRVAAGRRFDPDWERNAVYADYYAAYCELYPALRQVESRVAAARRRAERL